jgi:hypothetical protein
MNDQGDLGKAFQEYLQSGLNKGTAKEMCRVLDHSGLHNESKALKAYLDAQTISSGRSRELYWDQRKCISGLYPPSNPEPNDVWFDVVELTPMILIPRENDEDDDQSLDRLFWIAMHPVYQWQFNGFLGCAKMGRKLIQVPSTPDYLSAERFDGVDPMKFVTDVYQDEALAYVHWFGKYLCDHFELTDARRFLNDNEFSLILPRGMRLWEEMEFPASEFVRRAFGADTLNTDHKDQYNEFLLRESGENESLPNRVLYEEWERRKDIGFCTCVLLELGLMEDVTSGTIFFELLNTAPRMH